MELWLTKTCQCSYLITLFEPTIKELHRSRLTIDKREPFGEVQFTDVGISAFIGTVLKPLETVRIELNIKKAGDITNIKE